MAAFFISDTQLAERYGVHRTTIWRWVKTGEFPKPVKLSKGCTRWKKEDVDRHELQKAEV